MNNERRKAIRRVLEMLTSIEETLIQARDIIEEASSEEREYFDNMPENLQSSERGERASEAADALENAFSSLEDFDISEIVSDLENAME